MPAARTNPEPQTCPCMLITHPLPRPHRAGHKQQVKLCQQGLAISSHFAIRQPSLLIQANTLDADLAFHPPLPPSHFLPIIQPLPSLQHTHRAGYKQAVKPCQYGLSLNIDLSATAFIAGNKPLPDVVAMMLGRRSAAELRPPLSPRDMRTIRDALRGLRVSGTGVLVEVCVVPREGWSFERRLHGAPADGNSC